MANKCLLIALVILSAILPYWNSLHGEFLEDDVPIIATNPLIRDTSLIPVMFGTPYWGTGAAELSMRKGGLYRPFTMLTYAGNYKWGGLDPFGYHLVNSILHVLVSLCFFYLLPKFGLSPITAGLSAMIFGVLPIHTEAVSSCVGRAELLAALFVLLSWLLIYQETKPLRIIFSMLCFGAALLSKESASAYPLVLILSEYVGSKDAWKNLLQKRLPIWLSVWGVLLLYLEWRHYILGSVFRTGGTPYFNDQSLLVVLLTVSRFIIENYVWPMVSGLSLHANHACPAYPDSSPGDIRAWMCLLAISVLVAGTVFSLHKSRSIKAFCILIFFILLLPMSNILIRIETAIGAERFLYLPSLGFCMLVGLCLTERIKGVAWKKSPIFYLVLSLVIWWAFKTRERNKIWATELAYYTSLTGDVNKSPNALCTLADVHYKKGDYKLAKEFLNRAFDLDPTLPHVCFNLALIHLEEGDHHSAKRWFGEAIHKGNKNHDILYYLGLIAQKEGRFDQALMYYNKLLKLNPYSLIAHNAIENLTTEINRDSSKRNGFR